MTIDLYHSSKDLKIESEKEGEAHEISFKLTEGHLVAYTKTKETMSEHLKSISKDGLTPLFQYALGQYGTIEQDEDDLGDFTTFNEFKPSIKESATYVQIDNLITNRTESGLSAKLYNVNEVYLSKKVVSDQVRTIGELSVLLEDNAEITRINPSLLVKLKATGGKSTS